MVTSAGFPGLPLLRGLLENWRWLSGGGRGRGLSLLLGHLKQAIKRAAQAPPQEANAVRGQVGDGDREKRPGESERERGFPASASVVGSLAAAWGTSQE